MSKLDNVKYEKVAQTIHNSVNKNTKEMAEIAGIGAQYFREISKKQIIKDRLEELKDEELSKLILSKEDRLKMLTTMINQCKPDDIDNKIKLLTALDKLDDRKSVVGIGRKQIIIQLPDNERDNNDKDNGLKRKRNKRNKEDKEDKENIVETVENVEAVETGEIGATGAENVENVENVEDLFKE